MPLRVLKLFGFCIAVVISVTTSVCNADGIDTAAMQQDPRLEKSVSLAARNLPLKALLAQIGSQTGISVTMDERDPASGYLVFVVCDQVPAGKMMNALYGLFSARGGEWAWVRDGKAGAYTYTLQETLRAKHRTDNYQRVMDGLLSNYLAILRRLAPMQMEKRKPYRSVLKKALYVDNDNWMNSFFDSEGFWDQANFFFQSITPQQQEFVLKGGSASVALKTLPPNIYAFYHQNYLRENPRTRAADGTSVPVPEPETVQFFRADPNRSLDYLAPRIDMIEGRAALSWMGTGHLEVGVRDALKNVWMLPGDSMTDPASQRQVAESPENEATRREREKDSKELERLRQNLPTEASNQLLLASRGSHLPACLEQLARGSSTPLLAILATSDDRRFNPPLGKPVQQFLNKLEGNLKSYFYKWRDGVLLVNSPSWFTQAAPVISYTLLRQLHPNKQGHVLLSELAELMPKISEEQAQWLAEQTDMDNFKHLRPLLLFATTRPGVWKQEGAYLDAETIPLLQSVKTLPPEMSLADLQTAPIRFREDTEAKLPEHTFFLHIEQYQPRQKKWKRLNLIPVRFHLDLFTLESKPTVNHP